MFTGIVIGAGMAIAAFALREKSNREKVKKVITKINDEVSEYMGSTEKQTKVMKKIKKAAKV